MSYVRSASVISQNSSRATKKLHVVQSTPPTSSANQQKWPIPKLKTEKIHPVLCTIPKNVCKCIFFSKLKVRKKIRFDEFFNRKFLHYPWPHLLWICYYYYSLLSTLPIFVLWWWWTKHQKPLNMFYYYEKKLPKSQTCSEKV